MAEDINPQDQREQVDYSMPENGILIDGLNPEEKLHFPDFAA
jgi:hypothetical protein